MRRFVKKTSKKIGLPPGTPVYIGEKKDERVRMSLVDYDEAHFQEKELTNIEESFPLKETPTVTWINIDGIHQPEIIETIGKHFDIHPLIIEDIVHTGQRPKMQDLEDHLFVVLKMLSYNEATNEIETEQVSIILGPHFVISFQEREGDIFNALRERMRNGKGRVRKKGPDYLAYCIMDAIIDHYFIILEKLGERIEDIQDALITNPIPETLHEIQKLKREMIFLRKSVWPLREVISALERGESSLISESTGIYFRDVYDHTIQVIDTVETLRDLLSGMLDIYLSSISNKMNEVMKVLTIIATIFIPLTFIAGVYGMNFKYMPELEWRWGYFGVWLVMVVIVGGLAVYFRKKKWL
ncbi:MAG: magnesium/cobalt transporter CorA [Pseudomonadota bacterium]